MTTMNDSSLLLEAEPEYEYYYQDEDGNLLPVYYQYEEGSENQIEQYQYVDGEILNENFFIEDFGEPYIYESTSQANNNIQDPQEQEEEPPILKKQILGTHLDEVINIVAHGSGVSDDLITKRKGPTTLKCEFCGLNVKHPSKIKAHMRTHTCEKPFECNICGQTFTQRTPWKNHMKRHLGDTPFKCSYCSKSFPILSTCKAHEKKVHQSQQNVQQASDDANDGAVASTSGNQTQNSQKDESQIAEKASTSKDEIQKAKEKSVDKDSNNENEKYVCEACGKDGPQFSSENEYNEHIKRFHSKPEKPYSCRFDCNKTFPTISNRNEHEKIAHYKIKRFQCCLDNCNKLFTRRLYLSNHYIKCHPDSETIPDKIKGNRILGFPWDDEEKLPQFSNSDNTIFIGHSDGSKYLVEIIAPLGEAVVRDPIFVEDEYIKFYNGDNNNDIDLEGDSPPLLEPQEEIMMV